jgi:hypothetical protein
MPKKKAFVFDTNFIIQNQKLDEVMENLSKEFVVYVTQVSIDERIAQQCREIKKKFEDIYKLKNEYKTIIEIREKYTCEQYCKIIRDSVQKKYEECFGCHIIPFIQNMSIYSDVYNRANEKLPPFNDNDKASDKGFKDALMWLSILSFFKNSGESEVIFVSEDNGFKNGIDYLQKEFYSYTGKKIEIKPNSFYHELLKGTGEREIEVEKIPDINDLRIRVNETLEALRIIESYDYYGNECWEKTFIVRKKLKEDDIEIIFKNLKNAVLAHLFEESVSAQDALVGIDLENGEVEIPISHLQKAQKVYEEILQEFPQFLPQFYLVAEKIFNRNFKVNLSTFDDDGDIPF